MSKDLRRRNRSPPTDSYSHKQFNSERKRRKVRQIRSDADYAELEKHYKFCPQSDTDVVNKDKGTKSPDGRESDNALDKSKETWQDRMVKHYHSHLYKEYVLADLTRPGQVGLRWRLKEEVQSGKGHTTCGNKHCQSYNLPANPSTSLPLNGAQLLQNYLSSPAPITETEEKILLQKLPYGEGLNEYEVPFRYHEHGKAKQELVKLVLCLRCAPLLFRKAGSSPQEVALKARRARNQNLMPKEEEPN